MQEVQEEEKADERVPTSITLPYALRTVLLLPTVLSCTGQGCSRANESHALVYRLGVDGGGGRKVIGWLAWWAVHFFALFGRQRRSMIRSHPSALLVGDTAKEDREVGFRTSPSRGLWRVCTTLLLCA